MCSPSLTGTFGPNIVVPRPQSRLVATVAWVDGRVFDAMEDPAHRLILVVDVENSSGRPEYVRARLQRDTHEAIGYALAQAGVEPGGYQVDERGDGALVVL